MKTRPDHPDTPDTPDVVNQESSAPRRRSNFRAPAPGAVDAETLTRLFGEGSADHAEASARAEAPTAPPADDRAPKHRAEPPGNRRAGGDPAPESEPVESEPIEFEPIVPEPIVPEPIVPEPIVPEPIVPEPIVPDPIVPAGGEPDGSASPSPTGESPSRTLAGSASSSPPETAAFPWRLVPETPAAFEPELPSSPTTPAARRGRRRLAVGVSAAALLVVTGVGAIAVVNDVPASLFATNGSTSPAQSDAVAGTSAPTITSGLSEPAAPFTGGTSITVGGERLDEVTQVSVGGASAAILEASDAHLTFAVPATSGDAVGAAEVVFADGEGRPVKVSVPASDASASADASSGAATEPDASAGASLPATDSETDSLILTYTTDPGIDAQLAYVLAHWDDYNTAEYPAVRGKDAVNFASQSLIARGWVMDDVWNVDSESGAMSAAWSSSTALRDYLRTRTDRATELTDAEREQVEVGDLAQFDWDDSGDRDHTAVVTRVERTDAGTKVWVGSHTKDADYWDVDAALASGGGSVSWFSIR